jgi:hypothetical protein
MKKILSPLVALLLMLPLTGCFEDIVKVYDGPPVVEFGQYNQPGAPSVTSNPNYTSTVTFPAGATDATAELPLRLQLIANNNGVGYFTNDTHIGFRVAETRVNRVYNADTGEWEDFTPSGWSTTAQEGTHFRFLNSENRVSFPANSSIAHLRIEAMAENLVPGQSTTLVLELTDGDPLSPSENYKWYRIIIRKAAS